MCIDYIFDLLRQKQAPTAFYSAIRLGRDVTPTGGNVIFRCSVGINLRRRTSGEPCGLSDRHAVLWASWLISGMCFICFPGKSIEYDNPKDPDWIQSHVLSNKSRRVEPKQGEPAECNGALCSVPMTLTRQRTHLWRCFNTRSNA